jgi:bifunctional ADP-heptose synthase (sugar kinase/adenylyltransferase)
LNNIKSKIYNWDEIQSKLIEWCSENKSLVFSNGCFDILHLGHIEYLSKTKDLGDILIIGLKSF